LSELLNLRMADVAVKDGVTCLFVRKGKTDSSVRHVPCCPTVLGIVAQSLGRYSAGPSMSQLLGVVENHRGAGSRVGLSCPDDSLTE
jgi:hypothetical protein